MNYCKKIVAISFSFVIVFSLFQNLSLPSFAKNYLKSCNEFAFCVSEELKEKDAKQKSETQATSDHYSCRLFGKTSEFNKNFSTYEPEKIIMCEDGRFFLRFPSEADAKRCYVSLKKDCEIDYICFDTPIYANAVSEEDSSHLSYGPNAIGTDLYLEYIGNKDFNQTVVAVIDSGAANIDYLREHLTNGYDFVDNDDDPSNDTHPNSHGTFLASEIVDCVGTMPIKVMPVRVLNSISGSLINAVNGIHYAVDNGASVVNISLGGKLENCEALEDAIKYACEKDVTVVVCSGNEHDNTEKYCPAHIPEVITVSSVDSENTFSSSFSNYGNSVDFSAPGVDVVGYNAKGTLKTLSGTSMSTAFVSAAVAMIRASNPQLNSNQVYDYLKMISEDQGDSGWDPLYGWGTINLEKSAFIQHVWTTGVILDNSQFSIEIGSRVRLTYQVYPENATSKDVNWHSNNTEIATVDESGTVIAVGKGNTEITVCTEDGKYEAVCQIVVHETIPDSITIIRLPNKMSYQYGEELSIDGLVVEANYDGLSKPVENSKLEIAGYSPDKAGEQVVSILYLGCETSFRVSVKRTLWQTIVWLLSFRWLRDLYR